MRILLVEDHEIVRRGLRGLLGERFRDARFADADSVPAARALLAQQDWDLVMLDISLPGGSGLELVADAKRRRPVPVLVLSTHAEEDYAVAAFRAGADGYLTKGSVADELLAAVSKVLGGGKYVSVALAERLVDALSLPAERAPHELLSPRELAVLRRVASGRTIREIATELSLSEKTIATYRARLAQKLGLSSIAELTRYALEHGLLE
jgi:two-component system, NarL family, invasion response regulator UvrY